MKRDVAIKVPPASFSADPDRLRRFEQEAQAAGALNHPNITAVHDIGSHDGAPYIVTELLEGETLRAALAGGKLPQRKAIDYALQIAHGLAGDAGSHDGDVEAMRRGSRQMILVVNGSESRSEGCFRFMCGSCGP